jgi:hypothetical protein
MKPTLDTEKKKDFGDTKLGKKTSVNTKSKKPPMNMKKHKAPKRGM